MTGLLHEKEFTRSSFVKGGGALIVGFSLFGSALAGKAGAANTPNVQPDVTQVDSWLSINADNTVSMYPGKYEFGQGTWTGYRQIVAEELDVPVTSIMIPLWDSGSAHPFPNLGANTGSNGTANGGPPLRQAAAEARRALLGLASAQMGVPAANLTVSDGVVSGGGKTVKYSDLLGGKLFNTTVAGLTASATGVTAANIAPVKAFAQYKVVGTRVPRFDIPDQVTGKATYIQNVRIPGMLHGRPVRPRGQANVMALGPEGGPSSYTLLSVDESSISHLPDVQIVRKGNFLGVVAPLEYNAIQAAAQLKAVWSESNTLPGSGNLFSSLRNTPTRDAVILSYGNVDAAIASAAKVVSATYEFPFQMHGPIGPPAAVADIRPTSGTVFVGGQDSWGFRAAVAQVTGLPATSIRMVHFDQSSTFNPGPLMSIPADAAIMSQAVGKPVRVQWMRWDAHGYTPFGPPNIADIRGGLDANGKLVAYDYTSWIGNSSNNPVDGSVQVALTVPADPTSGSSTRGAPERLPGLTIANPASGGARVETFSTGDQYFPNIPNRRVTGKSLPSILKVASLRAPSCMQPAWCSESMMDELAHAANTDALAFRQGQTTHSGWLNVLNSVAAAANWKSRVSASVLSDERHVTGRGIAIAGENHANDDVPAGVVAEVQVDRKTGTIVVQHVYGAQDSGTVVNPASAENQISGMLVRGTSRALLEGATFSKQRLTALDWVTYPILRFKDHPNVTTIVISHSDETVDTTASQVGLAGPRYRGVGESIEAVVPAAIGNAVFDATGVRFRQIPLTPAKVRLGLAAAGRLYKA
jgi:CO/xanthine dehydrogenase Mo-binding subunit